MLEVEKLRIIDFMKKHNVVDVCRNEHNNDTRKYSCSADILMVHREVGWTVFWSLNFWVRNGKC